MIRHLSEPIEELLRQLRELLESLTDQQYSLKIPLLSGASIGQHTRHIIEFFLELENGYGSGLVNYDARKRDYAIETHRHCALGQLQEIAGRMERPDRPLILMADFGGPDRRPCQLYSNYARELLYNLEHTIHHMALLRIGVNVVATVELPDSFGVAVSTIKYRKTCAQ